MSERLSGPCSKGHHDYCLGARMLLPCSCDCHEHQEGPNGDPQVTADDH